MSNLKDQLVKLGHQRPDLRKHLRPVISSLGKSGSLIKEAKKDLKELKAVLRDVKKANFYSEANEMASELLREISRTGIFHWSEDFDQKVENLIGQIIQESRNIMRVEDQQEINDKHIDPLQKMKRNLPSKYDRDYYEEQKVESLKHTFEQTLKALNGRSNYKPHVEQRSGMLQGGYRSSIVPKQRRQQTDRQWKKERKRAKQKLERMLFPKYEDIVKDYRVARGDKNYLDVQIELTL